MVKLESDSSKPKVSIEYPNITITIEFAGVVVASTSRAIKVTATGMHSEYYIPSQDIKMQFLYPMHYSIWSKDNGKVTFWTLRIRGREAEAAAWSYFNPSPACRVIKDYISFEPTSVDKYSLSA